MPFEFFFCFIVLCNVNITKSKNSIFLLFRAKKERENKSTIFQHKAISSDFQKIKNQYLQEDLK